MLEEFTSVTVQRLSIQTRLTALETRTLRADMIEIYNILRGFKRTEDVKFFQRRMGRTRVHDWNLFSKQVRLDAGKFSFGNLACDEWSRLPSWIVKEESVNKFYGNLDHYLNDNWRFKKALITLSPLEPFALSCMLIVTVLGKLGADHLPSESSPETHSESLTR